MHQEGHVTSLYISLTFTTFPLYHLPIRHAKPLGGKTPSKFRPQHLNHKMRPSLLHSLLSQLQHFVDIHGFWPLVIISFISA